MGETSFEPPGDLTGDRRFESRHSATGTTGNKPVIRATCRTRSRPELIGREDVTHLGAVLPGDASGRRSTRGHQHNSGLDRDGDGIACEQL